MRRNTVTATNTTSEEKEDIEVRRGIMIIIVVLL